MSTESERLFALRRHCLVLVAMMAVMVVAFMTLMDGQPVDRFLPAPVWFYLNSFVNLAALLAAFGLRYRFGNHLRNSETRDEALRQIQLIHLISLLPLYTAGLFAGLAVYFGGERFNLLFTVPFFAFALVFFPSRDRIQRQLEVSAYGRAFRADRKEGGSLL